MMLWWYPGGVEGPLERSNQRLCVIRSAQELSVYENVRPAEVYRHFESNCHHGGGTGEAQYVVWPGPTAWGKLHVCFNLQS